MDEQSEGTEPFGAKGRLNGFVESQGPLDEERRAQDAREARLGHGVEGGRGDRLDDESRMEDEGGPPTPVDERSEPRPARDRSTRKKSAPTQRVAHELTVADVMTKSVRSVATDTTIKEVALIMAGEAIGVVPVVNDEKMLMGLITDRDIVIRVCAGDKGVDDLRAGDAMTPNPTGIRASESITNALALMARLQVRRLPVVDAGFRLIGLLSIGDIASRGDTDAGLRETLAEISNRHSFWNRIWR